MGVLGSAIIVLIFINITMIYCNGHVPTNTPLIKNVRFPNYNYLYI